MHIFCMASLCLLTFLVFRDSFLTFKEIVGIYLHVCVCALCMSLVLVDTREGIRSSWN